MDVEDRAQPSARSLAVALFAIGVLMAMLIGGGAPHLLRPFGADVASRPATVQRVDAGVRQAERAGVDVDGIVDRAALQPHTVAGQPGVLRSGGGSFTATFDGSGIAYRPADAEAPFTLALTAIELGAARLHVAPEPWTAHGAAAARSVSPGVTERVTTGSGEVEWDVVLDHRPAGAGDLRVVADLGPAVAHHVVRDPSGRALQFDLTGGGTVRIGELVVHDATGAVLYRALPTVSGGHMVLRVPERVLAHATYPLTVDPKVSSPVTVGAGFNPSVAFDGTNYLVVFEQGSGTSKDIYGARVSGSGAFLSGPFLVSTSSAPEGHPDVAWNGARFLVAWELQNQDTARNKDYGIYAQFVNSSGGRSGSNFVVYDPGSSNAAYNERNPAVASNGVNFVVTWTDNFNAPTLGFDVYYKTISGGGPVGFAQPIVRSTHNESSADVAWNGATYLIVYAYDFSATDTDVHGQRLDPNTGNPAFTLSDGTPNGGLLGGDFSIRTPAGFQGGPTVASENSNPWAGNPASSGGPFLVAWDEQTSDADIYGALVQPTGTGVGEPIVITNRVRDESLTDLAYNGSSYFATWFEFIPLNPEGYTYDVYGTRISRSGSVQDSPAVPVATDQNSAESNPAVTNGKSGGWGVAYQINGTIALRTVAPK
jgi:hypothetical protein